MYDHLDDPEPFRPSAAFRDGVARRGRRLRWRRRLTTGGAAALVMVVGLAAGGLAYVDRRNDAIDRVDVVGEPSLDEATNILVVGTDERPADRADGVSGARADTMAIVRLRADGTVGVLSFPRDLLVPGTDQVLSAAFEGNGAQGLIDTVGSFSGVPIDHYLELDFAGLTALVDQAEGLRIAVDRPLRDASTGLDLQPAACTTLDGESTLALLRSRHVEGDELSDLSRIVRNQAVVAAVIAQLAQLGPGPRELDQLAATLADHARLDDGLSLGRMVEYGQVLAAAGPDDVSARMVPVSPSHDANRLALAPSAPEMFEHFGAPVGAAPPPDPAAVSRPGLLLDMEAQIDDPGIGPCPPP
jgi:LCP family protein required for cell wall assembly